MSHDKPQIKARPGLDEDKQFAKALFDSKTLDKYEAIPRSGSRAFIHPEDAFDTGTHGRRGLSSSDYGAWRPNEAIPVKVKAAIAECSAKYFTNGLIRNIVDLMADFACQGITIIHPNDRIKLFHEKWFEQVRGKDRSERFCNLLFRAGNNVIMRQTKKLKRKDGRKLGLAQAKPDNVEEPELDFEKREIPWKYTFINPLNIEVSGGQLATFSGLFQYNLKISDSLRKEAKDKNNEKLFSRLPPAVKTAIQNGSKTLPIDPEKIAVNHYKKDDWDVWAFPMTYAVLSDIKQLEKAKLADMAALDGAISNVRLWTMGNLEHKIAPTPAAIAKLAGILGNHVGGGTIDLIWGPDLAMQDTNSEVYKFLGSEKYDSILNMIYAGLGIPPTLTGSDSGGGFTNNFISLQTLIQRLEYVRGVLTEFWRQELEIVQKSMGFKVPARIKFDRMTLTDDAAEKALLIQLADRDVLSTQALLEHFGEWPELEKLRIKKENKQIESGRMQPKAGPWHVPHPEQALQKIALQGGMVTPSQVGLELEEKKEGEKTSLEMQAEMQTEKNKGEPQQGRPKTSKDGSKRKTKEVKVRKSVSNADFISLMLWAKQAQTTISKLCTPLILKFYDKKNLRQLTKAEFEQSEQVQFNILCGFEPFDDITEDVINASINNQMCLPDYLKAFYSSILEDLDHEPNIEELRHIRSYVYTTYREELLNG